MPTVAAHVAAALARHLDQVFGLMGNGNAHLLDALLRENRVTYTAVRHEAGAVVAADAHYRVSGRIAAATTTYGAGFTNALTPLAEAAQARTPLILVVGDQPTPGPRPWDVDQIALASAVGVRTYTVGRLDAVGTTVIAIEHALAHRTPVVLALPYDMPKLDAGPIPEVPEPRLPQPIAPSPDAREAIRRAARALADAERPVLLAGRGAWLAGAGAALGRLAAASGAVTATTALGRGLFPDEARDLGVTGGFGAPGAMEAVRSADVVVAFGASLTQFTMRFGELLDPHAQLVQVDIAPTATHPRVGAYVRGDARVVAELLADDVAALGAGSAGRAWPGVDASALRAQVVEDEFAPDGRLDPRAVAARIGELLPEDRVVVSDGGHFIAWANMFWPVASPGRMVMVGTAYQSIGLGWPSVAGAAQAAPDAAVVLTTGDGGGLMALADLETAVRTAGGRGIAVVWNDGAYSAEVNLYGLQGLHEGPMRIPTVDFAALGRAAGAEAVVVERLADLDRLATWAAEPAGTRRFLVLDLRISGDVIAPYQHEVIRVNS
ncbi:thiamine pyrophosphate-binding protein [Microbacterium stercoris]|uniref:Thiamine pyrophosphate-binding protein n=1 Tax=Microbacterium stercoris TaxID=2820289 RepID=A0A939TS80_9MICO|nr:thiamine pyrophosphate-binding protein [Microbacterium stercoris]MBO3664921.1 thiamine pyrophosphate-binding protein [Microbacterium stercoris]